MGAIVKDKIDEIKGRFHELAMAAEQISERGLEVAEDTPTVENSSCLPQDRTRQTAVSLSCMEYCMRTPQLQTVYCCIAGNPGQVLADICTHLSPLARKDEPKF
jgi:hypothetical protein